MEYSELIKKRYSVRKYQDKKVEESLISEIIEAGRLAPSAGNRQPTVIYVLSDEQIEKMNDIAKYNFGTKNVFFIAYDKNLSHMRSVDNYYYGNEDSAITITHMMLRITDLGLGSCWVGAFNPEKAKELYSLPENIIPVAFLPFGYILDGDTPNKMHNERRPTSEFRKEL